MFADPLLFRGSTLDEERLPESLDLDATYVGLLEILASAVRVADTWYGSNREPGAASDVGDDGDTIAIALSSVLGGSHGPTGLTVQPLHVGKRDTTFEGIERIYVAAFTKARAIGQIHVQLSGAKSGCHKSV